MLCPKCDTYYSEGKKFCRDCGSALVSKTNGKSKKSLVSDILFVCLALTLAFGAGYVLVEKVINRAAPVPEPQQSAATTAAAPGAPVTALQTGINSGLAGGGPGHNLKIAARKNAVFAEGPEYSTSACLIEDGSNNLALSISTKPGDAVLYFDGEKRGKSPLIVRDLTAGKHVIGVSKNGYKTRNITVNLVLGENKEFSILLEKKQADTSNEIIRDPLRAENRI